MKLKRVIKFQSLKNLNLVFLLLVVIVSVIYACTKDKIDTHADQSLYNDLSAGPFSYYQNGNELIAISPSPHGPFKLRFNSTASAALDTSGELPAGTAFPTGSVIIKEVQNGGQLSLYAVMKKDPSNPNAASGWIWAELNPDGTTHYSTINKGDGCVGCHNSSLNRDLTKTFDLH